MMTGTGPYGPIEIGGMFTTLKVRKDQKPGDYSDPDAYQQPPGTRAFGWTGSLTEPDRATSVAPAEALKVRKPSVGAHSGH